MDLLQHMGRRDVVHVERRVLAHMQHIQAAQVFAARVGQGEVIARLIAHRQRVAAGEHLPVLGGQGVWLKIEDLMPARLRFEQNCEA